jgi:hypothetical protein
MTSSGLEPVASWLVAYCLNQLHYHMPLSLVGIFWEFAWKTLKNRENPESRLSPSYLVCLLPIYKAVAVNITPKYWTLYIQSYVTES